MPKVAVHENSHTLAHENNVGPTGKFAHVALKT